MSWTLEDVRCNGCHKLLLKLHDGALRPGRLLEVKCPGCNAMTRKVGEFPAGSTTRRQPAQGAASGGEV